MIRLFWVGSSAERCGVLIVTFELSILSMVCAVVLALSAALARLSRIAPLNSLASLYVLMGAYDAAAATYETLLARPSLVTRVCPVSSSTSTSTACVPKV